MRRFYNERETLKSANKNLMKSKNIYYCSKPHTFFIVISELFPYHFLGTFSIVARNLFFNCFQGTFGRLVDKIYRQISVYEDDMFRLKNDTGDQVYKTLFFGKIDSLDL